MNDTRPRKRPRKADTNNERDAQKHKKSRYLTADELPWKKVARSSAAGVGENEGMLLLEEIDGVDVVYEGSGEGKVVRFNMTKEPVMAEAGDESGSEEWNGIDETTLQADPEALDAPAESHSPLPVNPTASPSDGESDFDVDQLPEWQPFGLHPLLLKSLNAQTFITPTPIQSAALPQAILGKDVVGVAQTGSGKTLAYGLPILNALLQQTANSPPSSQRDLKALILAPTRELALQVSSHLNACLTPIVNSIPVTVTTPQDAKKGKGKDPEPVQHKAPPRISIAAVVGGMSAQKQRRILERGVDVLVATPGRLWDLIGEKDSLAQQIRNLQFLVLDEADRMVQGGHFEELENILRLTLRQNEEEIADEMEVARDDEEAQVVDSEPIPDSSTKPLQTFVFSATLSKDLQRDLKKGSRHRRKGGKSSTLDDLLYRLDFRDSSPQIIDLSPEGGLVSTLTESKIECVATDKDFYLYYFLMRYPGRSLVFVSSIDGIRRLVPLLELLKLKAYPLHSQLEQKQRLKNLDRFKSAPNGVLLATDVASRGLDIPAVDHVIHYQIPRSADTYVHRNGRTARAMKSGFALVICGPEDRRVLRAILSDLGRQEADVSDMVVDHDMLDKLKHRVTLARQIDSVQHKIKKDNHDRNWIKETAEALEVDYESEAEQIDAAASNRKDYRLMALKAELRELLTRPLLARGVSAKYITSGSKSIADSLLLGNHHETMLGLDKPRANEEVAPGSARRTKRRQSKSK
ncbi:DEAD-domain-containing protein [Sistotremastrum niveocremeum HHB9708]|uniref:RNA helicase n=1 Tax=Sistotremastrum niveocremeum HHB9708 TaxID=1314777 RepID=A0A164ZYR2_9AGAM|nr:DEAD-domain-containing protein [Sistotremastrum niveocremeum HHB9708]